MKVLRHTSWTPGMSPTSMTMVSTEIDLSVSPDYIVDENLLGGDELGVFVVQEVFDAPDEADIVQATLLSQQRASERYEDERNMAILYNYEAEHLSLVSPGGTMFGTIPAPLSAEQVAYTLKRLAAHPDYHEQSVLMPCDEGHAIVRLVKGSVVTEEIE